MREHPSFLRGGTLRLLHHSGMDLTCRVQPQAIGFTGIRASAIGSIPVTIAAKGLPSAKTWDDLI